MRPHMCERWHRRGMECPFGAFESEEEKETDEDATGKPFRLPPWLAIPLGEGLRRGLTRHLDIYDVVAAAEEVVATQAARIPVSASQNLFQALKPGMEVLPIAGAVAASGITALAVRRFGGGRFFETGRAGRRLFAQ